MTQIYPIPDAALDAHIAILGKTGGGKSYTARGLVERLLDHERRVCVLDPVGVWWGLRASHDGKSAGYSVAVLGGDEGDMPLAEAMAKPLAEIVAKGNVPMVIDYSEMGVGERNRFLTAFLADLYRLNRRALWLVLEEVDEIAPQQVRPEGTRLLDAVDKIARRGRARGFRLISISQRPQVVNKNVLTQTQTMVAHRLTAPLDRKAVSDWLRAGAADDVAKNISDGLPGLATGEAWVWAQDSDVLDRVTMPVIRTFDSSATPSADEAPVRPTTLARVDVEALKAALGEGENEEESTAAPATKSPDPKALKAAENRGYERGLVDGERTGRAKERARIMAGMNQIMRVDGEKHTTSAPPVEKSPTPRPRVRPARSTQRHEMPAAALRMIEVLDTNPPIRMSWNSLAASIGNKARGGHFNTVRKSLIDGGKVIEEYGLVRIAEPSEEAPSAMPPEELAARLRSRWKGILGGRAAEIIGLLEEQGPMTKIDVADALGCAASGGHWNSAWKSLRDNLVVTETASGWGLADELLAPKPAIEDARKELGND